MKRKESSKYPTIEVGNRVRTMRKKSLMEKERTSHWSDNKYEVESIEKIEGQSFYKLKGSNRTFMRNELLLVSE